METKDDSYILVKRFQNGDLPAFNLIVDQWKDKIHRFAYRFLMDSDVSLSVGERSFDFPKITKWASSRDLRQLRSGQISEQQFLNRIQTADLSEVSETREYNIFNSILESSVRSADFEHFRVRKGASYIYLPGLGVQFNLNVSSPGSQIMSFFNSLEERPNIDIDIQSSGEFNVSSEELDSMVMEIDSRREDMDSIRVSAEQSLDSLKVALKDLSVSIRDIFTGERELPDPEIVNNEKEMLYSEINRTVTDYGTTLSSLPDDEMLIISIHWSGRNADLPQRTYLRIRKSDISSAEPFIQEISRK